MAGTPHCHVFQANEALCFPQFGGNMRECTQRGQAHAQWYRYPFRHEAMTMAVSGGPGVGPSHLHCLCLRRARAAVCVCAGLLQHPCVYPFVCLQVWTARVQNVDPCHVQYNRNFVRCAPMWMSKW